jgi:hypothetical protein
MQAWANDASAVRGIGKNFMLIRRGKRLHRDLNYSAPLWREILGRVRLINALLIYLLLFSVDNRRAN